MRKVQYKKWYKDGKKFKYREREGFFHRWGMFIDKRVDPPMKRLRAVVEDCVTGFVYDTAPRDIRFLDKFHLIQEAEIMEPVLNGVDDIINDLRAMISMF